MAKLKEHQPGIFSFYCPGCETTHAVYTEAAKLPPHYPRWGFNGQLDAPTFMPSLLMRTGHYVKGQPQPPDCKHCKEDADLGTCTVCHSFVTGGMIRFLGDCTHHLAGQTVPLPELQ